MKKEEQKIEVPLPKKVDLKALMNKNLSNKMVDIKKDRTKSADPNAKKSPAKTEKNIVNINLGNKGAIKNLLETAVLKKTNKKAGFTKK